MFMSSHVMPLLAWQYQGGGGATKGNHLPQLPAASPHRPNLVPFPGLRIVRRIPPTFELV